MTDINSDSVKAGLKYLSSVTTEISELKRYINEASSSLDPRIGNPYGYLKELIRKIELKENDIVDLCNDFINEAEKTKNEISSVDFTPEAPLDANVVLAASATTGGNYNNTDSNVSVNNSNLDPHESNTAVETPSENPNNEFISENEKANTTNADRRSDDFEELGDNLDPKNIEAIGSGEEGSNENVNNQNSTKEGKPLLTDEEYDALDELKGPEDVTYIDEGIPAEEYIKILIEQCDYLSDEDKEYINAQLQKGVIRSAIGRILVAQKRQEIDAQIEALKKSEAYQNVIYYKEAAEAYKNAASLSINSKEQMDLWALQRQAETNMAQAENDPEYKRIVGNIEAKKIELVEYEKSCKLWEYDYILKFVENEDPEISKGKFEKLAEEAEEYGTNPFVGSSAAVVLFQNAKKYRDLTEILSDDEIKIYWYLREKESEAAAKEYLDLLESKINSYYGLQIAEEAFNNILDADAIGNFLGDLSADWEGIKIGTREWFEVVGNLFSKTGTMTPSEYAVIYINSMLGSMSYFIPLSKSDLEGLKNEGQMTQKTYEFLKARIDSEESISYLDVIYASGQITEQEYEAFKKLGNDDKVKEFIERNNTESGFLGMNHLDWLKQFFNSGVTTGNMLPSVLASVLTYGASSGMGAATALANTLSKGAGLATMYVYCLSADKNAALRDGRSEYSSWIHGLLAAGSEVGTEIIFDKIFGFIPGLPDFGMMPSSSRWKTLGKIAVRLFGLAPLGEITEEMAQYALFDPMADLLAYGETDFKFKLEEALNIALTTYMSTFQLQLGSTVISTPGLVKKSGDIVSVDIGNGTTVNLSYADLASCYDEKTGQINARKLNSILIKKTGATFTINGTEVGLTHEEINSCRDLTGHLIRSKVDQLLLSKLESIQAQEVNGNQETDIDIQQDSVPVNISLITELESFGENALAEKYIEKLKEMNVEVSEDVEETIIKACEDYQKLDNMFKETYGFSIKDFLADVNNTISDEARAQHFEDAEYLYKYCKNAEPEVTSLLTSILRDGIRLEGLEHNLKSIDSIIRKFSLGAEVKDGLRYTFVVSSDSYTDNVMNILYILKNNGYEVSYINNHWSKAGYKGLNVGLITAEGAPVEIQFHTDESYSVKEEFNHILYEIVRNASIPFELRNLAGDIMVENQSALNGNIPDGATNITDYNINSLLETKTYTDYDDFKAEYAEEGKNWFASLPEEVKDYFRSYKGEDEYSIGNYHALNRILRGIFFNDDGTKVSPSYDTIWFTIEQFEQRAKMTVQEFIDKTREAVKAMVLAGYGIKIKQNTTIYRGVTFDALSRYGIQRGDSAETIYAKLTKGGNFIYQDGGFMSSAPVPGSITEYKDVMFEINTQEGTAIIDLSAINSIEREVLFLPGQKFHIDGVEIRDGVVKGQVIIKMTSIPNTDSLSDEIFEIKDQQNDGIDVKQQGDITNEEDDWFDLTDLNDDNNSGSNSSVDEKGHVFDEWQDYFSDYEDKGFTTIKVDGKTLTLYDAAPEFDSIDEFNEYASNVINEADGIPKAAMAFLKRINNEATGGIFENGMYYAFMNLSSTLELPADVKTKLINLVINSSEDLRVSIKHAAMEELSDVLKHKFILNQNGITSAICDSILGPNFIEDGLNQEYDWTDFAEMMDSIMDNVIQLSVIKGKQPVLWSGFDNSTHDNMDKWFTTISNTTIGGLYFIETVFTNWNFDNQTYKVSELWKKLSEVYAKKLSTTHNPLTGKPFDYVQFLYPTDTKVTESFGTLFKEVELPQIVKDGTIKTITLAKTNPNTMEIVERIDIDISYLHTYYQIMSSTSDNDVGLNDAIFTMFLDDVEEKTK